MDTEQDPPVGTASRLNLVRVRTLTVETESAAAAVRDVPVVGTDMVAMPGVTLKSDAVPVRPHAPPVSGEPQPATTVLANASSSTLTAAAATDNGVLLPAATCATVMLLPDDPDALAVYVMAVSEAATPKLLRAK